jgi:hypothetical protein
VLAISSEKCSSALSAVLIAFVGLLPLWKSQPAAVLPCVVAKDPDDTRGQLQGLF